MRLNNEMMVHEFRNTAKSQYSKYEQYTVPEEKLKRWLISIMVLLYSSACKVTSQF